LVGAVEAQSDITRLKELDTLKDQFITVAAHEIKTPVTAIKGFAQSLLRREGAMSSAQQNALETIVRQSDRIDALVRDFLELSRLRQGPPRLFPKRAELSALVANVAGRMALGTGKHNLYISSAQEAWVDVEVERIQEVMMNLLDNAMRYSPLGGDVEVKVAREGSRAVVSVRDEGMGIPQARQENLFERFYRAHIGTPLDYGGLGVGLYISREIARQHGGDLWFESKEGEGSTFYFSLPLAPAAKGLGDGG
jgi:signal transduction histidine kinase